MKTCQDINAGYRESYRVLHNLYLADMQEAIKRDFPVGAEVLFTHGAKRIEGMVIAHGEFDFQRDRVKIKSKNGATWNKEGHEVTRLDQDPAWRARTVGTIKKLADHIPTS